MVAETKIKDLKFFYFYAWTLLLIVIFSFGGKAVFDSEGLPPITALHHFHAVSMMSWFVLFALQATLIHKSFYSYHRILGRLSPLIVISFISFSVAISLLNWDRTGRTLIITVNALNLTLFLCYYLAAIKNRTQTSSHMRWMLYATLILMGPAIGRIPEIFDLSPFFAIPGLLLLQIIPLIHDKWVNGKVHRVCWIGFSIFVLTVPMIVALSESNSWKAFLIKLLGTPNSVLTP